MSAPLPGAPPGFNSHLSLFCRAAGDVFSFFSGPNSTVLFAGNSTVGYSATMFDLNCSPAHACGSSHFTFRNNIILGFLNRKYRPDDAETPGLFYFSDPSVKIDIDHGIFYNLRSGPCPWIGRPDLICNDPRFVDEPPLTLTSESQLDNFNFRPSRGSPAIGHGAGGNSIATDYFGAKRRNPPSIGAVEP